MDKKIDCLAQKRASEQCNNRNPLLGALKLLFVLQANTGRHKPQNGVKVHWL